MINHDLLCDFPPRIGYFMTVCTRCNLEKPDSAFPKKTRRCRVCTKEVWEENRRLAGENPEQLRRDKKNIGRALKRKGIVRVDGEWYANKERAREREVHYLRQAEDQKGLCAICGSPESRLLNGRLVALSRDHQHETGAWRGLLCTACNMGLGLFQENTDFLLRAAEYVERYAAAPLEQRVLWSKHKRYPTEGVLCEISGAAEWTVKAGVPCKPIMDHEHESGFLRGVLTRAINAGLGQFRDDPKLLRAAAQYLLKWGVSPGTSCARVANVALTSRPPRRASVPPELAPTGATKRGIPHYK